MHRPTTLTGFYCGACEARFPTREEREAHKATAHAERDAMIAAGKARRAEREARGQNRPVGIVEAPRSLPKGNGGGRSRFNGYEAGPTEKADELHPQLVRRAQSTSGDSQEPRRELPRRSSVCSPLRSPSVRLPSHPARFLLATTQSTGEARTQRPSTGWTCQREASGRVIPS